MGAYGTRAHELYSSRFQVLTSLDPTAHMDLNSLLVTLHLFISSCTSLDPLTNDHHLAVEHLLWARHQEEGLLERGPCPLEGDGW